MECLGARRLTGPNLLWNKPGTVLDVRCSASTAASLLPVWQSAVHKMLKSVGWSNESTTHCLLSGGISLAMSAPIDALYAASAINDWAWACCEAAFDDKKVPDFGHHLLDIRNAIDAELNPRLLVLEQAARAYNVSFLWDDDEVSLGLGTGAQTWPFRELPPPESLDWNRYHDIPVAIVTGTNGKTTTVRLAQHIMRGTGRNVGFSSTGAIAVNDRIIDRGDWSGPGGARQVLRQTDVEVAILETARGGLLRRGLGVNSANVAVITNVTEDHLGDFGSASLDELLNIKWIVSRAVENRGTLVLNADDQLLIDKSRTYAGNIVWFSLHDDNPLTKQHCKNGGVAYLLAGDELTRFNGDTREMICPDYRIPITMDGAARHNVANALAAAALAEHLGASLDEIRDGLLTMSQEENPGRSNSYSINGINVLIDFAHNPAAMEALFDMVPALPGKRRLLAFGQAGDRPDDLIRQLARSAWAIGLDAVIVSELATYHRGRAHGEVYAIIRDELIRCGAEDGQISHFNEEMESLQSALDWAQPGDLIIMLALGDSAAIQQNLQLLQDNPKSDLSRLL